MADCETSNPRPKWETWEDNILREGWDIHAAVLQKNGLGRRTVSAIQQRKRKLGIKSPVLEPRVKKTVRLYESLYARCQDYIEEGEDGPTLSHIVNRALGYYLFESDLEREKYWRNLLHGTTKEKGCKQPTLDRNEEGR